MTDLASLRTLAEAATPHYLRQKAIMAGRESWPTITDDNCRASGDLRRVLADPEVVLKLLAVVEAAKALKDDTLWDIGVQWLAPAHRVRKLDEALHALEDGA